MVVGLDRKLSDHCPVVMKDSFIDFGPNPFRWFDCWLQDAECERVVVRGWSEPVHSRFPDTIFRDKLKNVKEALRKWNK